MSQNKTFLPNKLIISSILSQWQKVDYHTPLYHSCFL
jgi:hypothetical protein